MPICVFSAPASDRCCNPRECGLQTPTASKVEFASSSTYESAKALAVRSVGALIEGDKMPKGTAFHVGDNWILTAGHVFLPPTKNNPIADAENASTFILVLDFEATGPTEVRRTFALDPTQPVGSKFKRRSQHIDYAISKVAANADGQELKDLYPAVPIAVVPPAVGDDLYVIHHQAAMRAKQLSRATCTSLTDRQIFLSNTFDGGASGGLIVNTAWEAVAILTDKAGNGVDTRGTLLAPALRDLFPLAPEVRTLPTASQIMATSTWAAPADHLQPFTQSVTPAFPDQSYVKGLPSGVKAAFPSVAIAYAVDVETARTRTGTAFAVARNWILTAHHVARCREEAAGLGFDFRYTHSDHEVTQQFKANTLSGEWYFASQDGIFSCDGQRYHMDYALIRVRALVDADPSPPSVNFSSSMPNKGEEIFLVQHANIAGKQHKGVLAYDSMKKSDRNQFQRARDELVFHEGARSPGASGGPILNAQGKAFAMHTHDVLTDSDMPLKEDHPWGTKLSAVARDLRERFPSLYDDHPELREFLDLAT